MSLSPSTKLGRLTYHLLAHVVSVVSDASVSLVPPVHCVCASWCHTVLLAFLVVSGPHVPSVAGDGAGLRFPSYSCHSSRSIEFPFCMVLWTTEEKLLLLACGSKSPMWWQPFGPPCFSYPHWNVPFPSAVSQLVGLQVSLTSCPLHEFEHSKKALEKTHWEV